MKSFNVGDIVTVKSKQDVYQQSYDNPCYLRPGNLGVIAAVKVPKVVKTKGGLYFCCIDFIKFNRVHRAGVDYNEIVLIHKNGISEYKGNKCLLIPRN